jgi:phosphopantetheinyl transferase
MHRLSLSIAFALVSLVLGTSMVDAQDACSRLWVQRNAIYKANGYCFKTERAISYFGNAGCQYDEEADVPLSHRERARIARIIAEERSLGCR